MKLKVHQFRMPRGGFILRTFPLQSLQWQNDFFCCFSPLSDEGSPRGYLSARRHKTTHTHTKNYDRIARFLKVKRWSSPANVIGNLQNKWFPPAVPAGTHEWTCYMRLTLACGVFLWISTYIQGISHVWEWTLRCSLYASSWSWRQNTPPCWLN